METLIGHLKASKLAPGIERIIVPGEPEYEARAQNLASGTIPLLRTTYDAVAAHIDKWDLVIELPPA